MKLIFIEKNDRLIIKKKSW